jgi:hypothetical protein
MEAYKGSIFMAPLLILALYGGEWLTLCPGHFSLGKNPYTHSIGCWVGSIFWRRKNILLVCMLLVCILGLLGIYNLNSNHTHTLINSLMLTATNAQVLLLLLLLLLLLTPCQPDGLLIKYPQFPDVLNTLNVQPHNIFLLMFCDGKLRS